jgi:arylsulfatase A-like enzyme
VPVRGQYYDLKINDTGELVDYPGCCEHYEADLEAVRAADFIRRAAADTAPFLVYLSSYGPHLPSTPALRHQTAFGAEVAPRTPSFDEADVSDKPETISRLPRLTPELIERTDGIFRDRLRTMLAVEELMDTLVAALEEAGVREETYIFFTSENGWHYGEHRMRWGKTTSYDEDIRVPLFVLGPGVPSGGTVDQIALSIDLAPTIAQLAGATTPGFVDGRSMTPLLLSSSTPFDGWRQGFITQRWRPYPDSTAGYMPYWLLGYRGLRTDDYLYVEWDTGEFELYDRGIDPFEMDNIYDTADPALVQSLANWLDRLAACSGGACTLAEDGS